MTDHNLYAKFVPLNAYTLASLITKKIWFSTVYDFNDDNELTTVSNASYFNDNTSNPESLYSFLKNQYDNNIRLFENLNRLSKFYEITREEVNCHNFNNLFSVPHGNYRFLIVANYIYSRKMIFSMSDIEIFQSDAAMIMMSHYAKNNGLTLIYQTNGESKLKEVDYTQPISVTCQNLEGSIENSIPDDIFLKKSKTWEHEKEFRCFSDRNGYHDPSTMGLSLKAILYTHKTEHACNNTQELLTIINNTIYSGKLKIMKLEANIGRASDFTIAGNQANTWLRDNIQHEN